jgi:hypothetical protein
VLKPIERVRDAFAGLPPGAPISGELARPTPHAEGVADAGTRRRCPRLDERRRSAADVIGDCDPGGGARRCQRMAGAVAMVMVPVVVMGVSKRLMVIVMSVLMRMRMRMVVVVVVVMLLARGRQGAAGGRGDGAGLESRKWETVEREGEGILAPA